ncbi:MAG: hypothetical protein NZM26_01250 [Patescibacteria group bacterium]|nr:hypothetical protein [Patescibacteria group bacterium]
MENKGLFLKQILIIIVSSIPVFLVLTDNTSLSLTIASIYGYSWLIKNLLQRLSDNTPLPLKLKFILWGTISGMLLEILAIIDNLNLPDSEKVLLNKDTNIDLYLALGFYFAFAFIWSFLANKYDYTSGNIFIISGLCGIFIKQSGAIFASFNLIAWIYVFFVYGSCQALPGLLVENQLKDKIRIRLSWGKKFLYGFCGQTISFIFASMIIYTLAKIGEIQL